MARARRKMCSGDIVASAKNQGKINSIDERILQLEQTDE
jgi:hypothetical protein